MPDNSLDSLAARSGIADGFTAPDGSFAATSPETRRRLLEALRLPTDEQAIADFLRDAPAPRSLELRHEGPARCHIPQWLTERPAWGITCQLYEVRAWRDWGIGDFAGLEALCAIAARLGADFVGVTPLHALFLGAPERCSPFFPSNRRFLNPLHIAVERVPGFSPDDADPAVLERLRDRDLVDYRAVAEAKLAALRAAWERWNGGGRADFETFCEKGGEALYRHALFEAISLRMVEDGHGAGWTGWPDEFRSPDSAAVRGFAEAHRHEIEFHRWLQWIADRQLAQAARAAREAGLRIGLYLDLAVGEAPDGSAVWSDPNSYVSDVSIGAPPDYFSTSGQDWGLTALSPVALQQRDFRPWVEMVDAVSRHAGALRIDHVMALWQLFLVPRGVTPAEGAYLRFPIATLLQELAAMSQARGLAVIGEDLGYVPTGFREVMYAAGILSCRILYFEQENGSFRPPEAYPRQSLACLSTHDLPTLYGWWNGHDVELRLEYGMIDEASARAQADHRHRERADLAELLMRHCGLDAARATAGTKERLPDELVVAVHRFLARSAAMLAGVRLADLTGETEPTNLPGTEDGYPNWRRRSRMDLDGLENSELVRAVAAAMREERPR